MVSTNMMMTKSEKEAILNLALGKITKGDFFRIMNIDESMVKDYALKSLIDGYADRDSDIIELTFYFGYKEACSEEFIPILNELIIQDWHISHENIARLLQALKSPLSIDYLYRTVFVALNLDYLPGDMSGALIRKCCFALGDIDTPQAREMLKSLNTSDNPLIKEAAFEQIERNTII